MRRRPAIVVVAAVLLLAACLGAAALSGPGRTALRALRYPTSDAVFGNGSTTLLILGDSFTQGVQSSSASKTYPALIAARKNWRVRAVAEVNSGYVTPGLHGSTMSSLFEKAKGTDADIVLLAAGYNDGGRGAKLMKAAVALVAKVHARWPDAKILMLGPINSGPRVKPELVVANQTLQSVARQEHVEYVDGLHWLDEQQLISSDGVHPDDEGYAREAALLESRLPGHVNA